MDSPVPGTSKPSSPASPDISLSRSRLTRARKRRYISSESSSDIDPVLPENILEVEKNLHASAVKNNLDDVSVKKILKKVVTNDHVLALVKLREEEENKAMEEENLQPKLTRAKVKELMKVSPKTAWNLENMELTPIKHIPVRTRPEVTALIAQELPEDEDDDEYEPTYDDVPSDDDHTLESCSDVDSQPRTPATPNTASPRVRAVKDGPFKVPQNITPRRKLDMDDDATIARRTRSKLSLSSIPIDHIESSFVPPDEPPMPAVDDVWTEFLQECLNPETEKDVDDDDDPEYNVAADPDSHDEDEEGLGNLLKISKKELNDLVTELFNVMPEGLGDEVLTGKLANEVTQDNGDMSTHWANKQEVISDNEDQGTNTDGAQARKTRLLSIGKSEPASDDECQEENQENNETTPSQPHEVTLSVVEGSVGAVPPPLSVSAPAPLQNLLLTQSTVTVEVQQGAKVLPEQILILEQQLRQHVQIAAFNFLQLFVHPVHWSLAPTYKEYLETLTKITKDNPKSVANVCNLKLAMELVTSWEKSVSADTEENIEMVKFIHKEVERSRRRSAQNSLYVGDFHKRFIDTVAHSPVFLYPHLLPPLPYRSDGSKRFGYTQSEDELITLGIDEFWQYVEENPDLYKLRSSEANYRWGLVTVVALVCKHMLPWMLPKSLLAHIQHVRKFKDPDHPINKFFKNREVTPVQHVLLPFNPKLTLYQHPEQEMPRIWVKYLAKASKRFRTHLYRRGALNKVSGLAPAGVPVALGTAVETPSKAPLPPNFKDPPNRTKPFNLAPKPPTDTFDLELTTTTTTTDNSNVLYSVIQTPAGAYLIPLTMLTNTVDATTPISSSQVQETVPNNMPEQAVTSFTVTVPTPITKDTLNVKDGILTISNNQTSTPIYAPVVTFDHCECCIKLRKITKRQSLITEYFKEPKQKSCPCKEKRKVKYPKVTRKFKLLLENYKCKSAYAWKKLKDRITDMGKSVNTDDKAIVTYRPDEIAAVTAFQLKLTIRTMNSKYCYMKKKVSNVLAKLDPDIVCPMKIMKELVNILSEDCEDMYREFFGFMTKEQADKMGRYMDYFKQECLRNLIQKIEEHVTRKEIKQHILTRLLRTLAEPELSPCDVCAKILDTVAKYPKLAEYVFSLFPHRRTAAQFANKAVVEMPKQVTENTEAMRKSQRLAAIAPGPAPAKDKVKVKSINKKQNAIPDQPIIEQIEKPSTGTLATDNTQDATQLTADRIEETSADPSVTDNTQNTTQLTADQIQEKSDPSVTDNTQNTTQLTADQIQEKSDPSVTDNTQNTTQLTTDRIEEQSTDSQATDYIQNTSQLTTDRIEDKSSDASATDNIQNITADQPKEPTTDNVEDTSELNETQQSMDYEADHSASDDDGSADNLTIVEEPVVINQRRTSSVKNENTETENAMDTSELTVTKTETPDCSESDMSTMIMSEDEIVKKEPAEWNRDEDKQVLKVLQQSLTPEEMKDKTILEIIEQKKVLQLAAENLPEKTLDDVMERMLYLLEFLVNQQ